MSRRVDEGVAREYRFELERQRPAAHTRCVFTVVSQKSAPPQIRQLILYFY